MNSIKSVNRATKLTKVADLKPGAVFMMFGSVGQLFQVLGSKKIELRMSPPLPEKYIVEIFAQAECVAVFDYENAALVSIPKLTHVIPVELEIAVTQLI